MKEAAILLFVLLTGCEGPVQKPTNSSKTKIVMDEITFNQFSDSIRHAVVIESQKAAHVLVTRWTVICGGQKSATEHYDNFVVEPGTDSDGDRLLTIEEIPYLNQSLVEFDPKDPNDETAKVVSEVCAQPSKTSR